MIAWKARAYQSEAPYKCSTLKVGSWPYPKGLDYAGKACQGQKI